ncbi:organic hydroperoxide resistance protein [Neogemmobacter tilapiae]|nr:organic hydroperoxide resistance protein [Gemmobacter tilapiae]
MMTKVLYTAESQAKGGGRDGQSATLDGALSVTLAPPTALGGSGKGNNPEQLFAVGYAACYLGAIRYAASQDKTLPAVPADATVNATVGIGPRDDGGFGLTIGLKVNLPGVEKEAAARLVQAGHHICPYSNALKAGLPVETVIV